jgi:hypothetical protein
MNKYELSKRKIETLKNGEVYYQVKYIFGNGRFRTYYGASTLEAVKNMFNNDYGFADNVCTIIETNQMKEDDNLSIIVYTHVFQLLEIGYKLVDAFSSVSKELKMSEKAVSTRYYIVDKQEYGK